MHRQSPSGVESIGGTGRTLSAMLPYSNTYAYFIIRFLPKSPHSSQVHDPEEAALLLNDSEIPCYRIFEAAYKISHIGGLNAQQRLRRLLWKYDTLMPLRKQDGLDPDIYLSNAAFAGYRMVSRGNDSDSIFGKLSSCRTSFYEMVKRFRRFEATDLHDKIYALIGIADTVQYVADAEQGTLPRISYAPGSRYVGRCFVRDHSSPQPRLPRRRMPHPKAGGFPIVDATVV